MMQQPYNDATPPDVGDDPVCGAWDKILARNQALVRRLKRNQKLPERVEADLWEIPARLTVLKLSGELRDFWVEPLTSKETGPRALDWGIYHGKKRKVTNTLQVLRKAVLGGNLDSSKGGSSEPVLSSPSRRLDDS